MRRLSVSLSAVALVFGFIAPSNAAAQQSVNFYLGGFTPRALDARSNDDVLVQDGAFLATAHEIRGIDISEFNNVTIGGEWLFGITPYLEGGLGVGFYQRTVPTVHTLFSNNDGTDIEQRLKLRIVPVTATVRFLPFGTGNAVQPYIGAGVGVFGWRYSETGQFIDPNDIAFPGNFVASGAAVGPVVMGGVRAPVGPAAVGFELRYQSAEGDLPIEKDFAGSKIDLGGMNYLLTLSFRF